MGMRSHVKGLPSCNFTGGIAYWVVDVKNLLSLCPFEIFL